MHLKSQIQIWNTEKSQIQISNGKNPKSEIAFHRPSDGAASWMQL